MWGNQFLDTYSHYNFNFSFPVKLTNNPIRIIIWQYWWWLFFSSIFILYYFVLTKFLLKRPLKFRPKIVTSYRSHGRWGDIIVSLIPIYWCLNILTHSNTLLKLNEMQTETSIVTVRVRGRQWYWVYKLDIYNFFNINNFKIKLGFKNKLNILNNNMVKQYCIYNNFWKNIFLNKNTLNKNNKTEFVENITDNLSKEKNFFNILTKINFFNKKWYTNYNVTNIFFNKIDLKKKNFILKNELFNNLTIKNDLFSMNSIFKKSYSSNYCKFVNKHFNNIFYELKEFNNLNKYDINFLKSKKQITSVFDKNKYTFDLKNKNGYSFYKLKLQKIYEDEVHLKKTFNIIDIKLLNNISKKSNKTYQKYSSVIDQNRKNLNNFNNQDDQLNFLDNDFFNKNNYNFFFKENKNLLIKELYDNIEKSSYSYLYKYQILNSYKKEFSKTNNSFGNFFKKKKNFLHNQRLLNVNNILVLPINMNITIITNSYDVIHSWFIPGLGLKMDCVPGRSTHHTLFIDSCGIYYGQCAEICGRFHHHMPIKIAALTWEHFLLWWYHQLKNTGIHQFKKDLNKDNLNKINSKKKFNKLSFFKNKRPFI